jgi:hypothetical protein
MLSASWDVVQAIVSTLEHINIASFFRHVKVIMIWLVERKANIMDATQA